jgi:flagellar biosynthetic protein FlhB
MAEQAGEKTESPTPKRMEEALKHGQIARSAEVQTVFVLLGALAALSFVGREMWQRMVNTMVLTLGHLHDTSISANELQGYAISGTLLLIEIVGPVVIATILAGLLAGAIQNKFNTASEALKPDWNRLNPVEGFSRVFSARSLPPTGIAILKLLLIIALTYSAIRNVLSDPIFTTAVSIARIAGFLAQTCMTIFLRVCLVLLVIAAADYGYQFWRTQQDLLMTREEVKEDMKSAEGNPRMKAAMRRRRRRTVTKARMLAQVPHADVVVTNPTHIAVALRYDRKTMKAPMIVAKGIRLNAQEIREIAQRHQVPLVENKPLARSLFKYGRVGNEIPGAMYAAVAEILAWVYRVNRYRYFAEMNRAGDAAPAEKA